MVGRFRQQPVPRAVLEGREVASIVEGLDPPWKIGAVKRRGDHAPGREVIPVRPVGTGSAHQRTRAVLDGDAEDPRVRRNPLHPVADGGMGEPTGRAPTFALHDIMSGPLPLAAASVQLVSLNAVLHLLPEPFLVCAEIQRVMASDGILLLHDWIRTSLQAYMELRTSGSGAALEESRRRAFRLFPTHNKYTSDDWKWLLSETGFTIRAMTQLRPYFQTFICTK